MPGRNAMTKKILISMLALTVFVLLPQNSAAQTPNEDLPKEEAVGKLIELTIRSHPMLMNDKKKEVIKKVEAKKLEEWKRTLTKEDLEKYEQEQEQRQVELKELEKTMEEMFLKEGREAFDRALVQNKNLSKDEKSFVKANYPELLEIWKKMVWERVDREFETEDKKYEIETERLIREGLQISLTKHYNARELNDLIIFFQSPEGQKVLSAYDLSAVNENKFDFMTPEQAAAFEEFTKSPTGKKFIKVHFEEPTDHLNDNESRIFTDEKPDPAKEVAEINKMFERFVKDNRDRMKTGGDDTKNKKNNK